MTDKPTRPPTPARIARDCLAIRVRMIHRVVSALYDDALRPHGLRAAQFGLLTAVAGLGTAQPTDLGRVLHMDKSTLSRNIDVLERNGWVEVCPGADARTREIRLTRAGAELLETAVPAWEEAQRQAATLLEEPAIAAIR